MDVQLEHISATDPSYLSNKIDHFILKKYLNKILLNKKSDDYVFININISMRNVNGKRKYKLEKVLGRWVSGLVCEL